MSVLISQKKTSKDKIHNEMYILHILHILQHIPYLSIHAILDAHAVNRCITGRVRFIIGKFPFYELKFILETQ